MLLLLTGKREMEVLRMRWDDIDWETPKWRVPAEHSKNRIESIVPLSEFTLAILLMLYEGCEDNTYVFQSPITGKHYARNWLERRIKIIRKLTGILNIRIHDLRRTASTYWGMLQILPHIKDHLLHHVPKKLRATYDLWQYFDEKKEALIAWDHYLHDHVGAGYYNQPDDDEPPENMIFEAA